MSQNQKKWFYRYFTNKILETFVMHVWGLVIRNFIRNWNKIPDNETPKILDIFCPDNETLLYI